MTQEFVQLLNDVAAQHIDICIDSRQAAAGMIFVAVPGAAADGAHFIPMAVQQGARIIVCRPQAAEGLAAQATGCRVLWHEDPREALWQLAAARYNTAQHAPKVLAVTGTNGKTTTAYLLEHVLQALGHSTGVLGTVSYRWPGHSEQAPLTTPDALRVHRMLYEMAEAGVEYAIMEASSHALDQQRVDGVPFAGAIFTNLTQDHLDFHHDMESYFAAKSRLFLDLANKNTAMAINADDAWGRKLLAQCPQAYAYGLEPNNLPNKQVRGTILSMNTEGMRLAMTCGQRSWELASPLVGAFNAANLMGVQSLLLALGFDTQAFAPLHTFHGVSGRLERVVNKAGLDVFVDYAHTPDALIKAQNALRGAGFSRIITLFGCGGDRDRTKRPLMAAAVAEYSDLAVLTSDNPRTEDPMSIIADALPGLSKAKEQIVEADRRTATAKALQCMHKGDALLIAGKGHEDYQIIGTVKHHYSDQETVRELLA
ncbi:MAG: UDP-N-acetylmuramoyl-L-alanyl-D-glutamate--2,6-diaminopimelate ligase [Desulfovibrionaceae bacterium]|nr:UDP-N-acetylmuramoyl-L-alanyl-D-glutamate--2,6-diaminopimelate ligase [Desulfovibrionaceae bacterium]